MNLHTVSAVGEAANKGRSSGHPRRGGLTARAPHFRIGTHNLKILGSNPHPRQLRMKRSAREGAFSFSVVLEQQRTIRRWLLIHLADNSVLSFPTHREQS